MGERVWLDVPFAEKGEAKKGGARWDPRAKRWFAPPPGAGDRAAIAGETLRAEAERRRPGGPGR